MLAHFCSLVGCNYELLYNKIICISFQACKLWLIKFDNIWNGCNTDISSIEFYIDIFKGEKIVLNFDLNREVPL